jgi:hypothetical protein
MRLLAVQLVVALVLLEIAIRVVGPRTGIRRLLYHPAEAGSIAGAATVESLMDQSVIGFAPFTESYGFVLNSRSLRTREYDERKAPGVSRILVFGDSFTWASGGLPHEYHWPVILEDRLRKAVSPQVEVLRLGVPAVGPAFLHRLWQLEGARLEPDLVVVAFFVGNDFLDHQGIAATRGLRDHSWVETSTDRWMSFRVARNLYRIARGVVRERGPSRSKVTGRRTYQRGGYSLPEYLKRFQPDRPTFSEGRFLEIEARRMTLCRDDKAADFERLLERVGATLVAFHDEVDATGARFLVMIIPDEYQVDPRVSAAVVEKEGIPLEAYDLGRPARRLSEYLSARGIEVLDLGPDFVRGGARSKLYRIRNTHWNHQGNLLAGELLARHIVDPGFETPPDANTPPTIE